MTQKLARHVYEQLVREDLAWLAHQPRTLEREHIAGILKDSVEFYYSLSTLPPLAPNERRNVHGEEVTVNEAGNCTDCGYPPDQCSPDDHK